ncbi:unnamed protein product [Haemonchus placei]|uniref:Uncharacterized protein n=1 Tax=Haemonchus placei TaxID=6290 RepID=A0A0N4WTD3_HAEPC|nr:unnamed protein product [Haemonchus placei]
MTGEDVSLGRTGVKERSPKNEKREAAQSIEPAGQLMQLVTLVGLPCGCCILLVVFPSRAAVAKLEEKKENQEDEEEEDFPG